MATLDQVDEGSNAGWFFTELPENKYFFESDQNKPVISYTNDRLAPKEIRELTKKDLKERVKEGFQKDAIAEYTIDKQLVIRVPSQKFCEESIKAWEKYAEACGKKELKFGWGFAALFIAETGVLALGYPLTAMALGVSAVASGIFWLKNTDSKSKSEIAHWQNPYQNRIAERRQAAYGNGFVYAYKENLKVGGQLASNEASLREEEVKFLYEEYFDEYCRKMLMVKPSDNASRTAWLEKFVNDNPLSNKMMEYGWEKIPDHFKGITENYAQIVTILSGSRAFFNDQKIRAGKAAEEYIGKINQKKVEVLTKKEESLAAYRANRDNHYAIAFEQRHEQMKKAQTPEERAKVQDEYVQSTKKYHNFYKQIVDGVNKPFDKKISQVKDVLYQTMAKIDREQAAAPVTYFEDAWTMLEMAQNLRNKPDFVYSGPIGILNGKKFEPSFPGMDDLPVNFDQALRQAYATDPNFLSLLDEKPAPYTPFVLRREADGCYLLPHFEKNGFTNFGTYKCCGASQLRVGRDFHIDVSKKIAPKGWIFEATEDVSSKPAPVAAGA